MVFACGVLRAGGVVCACGGGVMVVVVVEEVSELNVKEKRAGTRENEIAEGNETERTTDILTPNTTWKEILIHCIRCRLNHTE